MKIFGTIRNSKNQDPVKGSNIRFSIEGTEIISVISNEHGKYEYIAEEDHIGQTLDFAIQKDGFERKNISYEIDKDEIKADIMLNEIETEKKEIKEVIEKTRIFGTIRNSVNRDPVQEANIKLSIEGTQIASITSNKQGEYEYIAEQDYTGQTLDISIKKDNYIKKNISYEIDKPTINSDILIDEIKIKIKGKICDETDNPLDNASISFSIGNSTINRNSDKDGSFSFTIGQQFLNQTIGYEVNKEGFKITSGKLKLLENLKCINISKTIPPTVSDKSMWIKVAAVGTVLTVAAVVLFALPSLEDDPELSIDPYPINCNFEPETRPQTFVISNDGDGTLEWDIYCDRDWIMIFPDSGTDSGTVSVSVNSAGMAPGSYTGRITVESNGGTETGRISLYMPEDIKPPSDAPEIHFIMADPEHIDDPEGETILSWEVSGATSVTIDGVGPVEVSEGSINRWVEQTTTFILRATNDAGLQDVKTVTVIVNPEELLPQLSVNPDPLLFDFGSMNEGETDSSTFSIENIGGGILKWNIIDDQPWITVAPTSGTESGSVTVTVSVNTIMIDPGDYTEEIIIESNGGTENGIISLYVTAPSVNKNEALEFSLQIVETYFTGDADQFCSYLADTIYSLEGEGPISKEELIDEIYSQQFPFGGDYSDYTMDDYLNNYNPYILDYGQYSEEYPSISELNIDGWSPDDDDFLFIGWKVKDNKEDFMWDDLLVFMVTYQKGYWEYIAISG